MLISELIKELQGCLDSNGDREVMVAEQATYPLAANLVQVYDPMFDECDYPGASDLSEADAAVLWLAASEVARNYDRSPYAPRRAWSQAYS